jgi:hypothetical protein
MSLVDAVTLLGNTLWYEFSMKQRELLRTEVLAGFKSLCRDNQPYPFCYLDMNFSRDRDIVHIKWMSLCKVTAKRKFVGENNSNGKFSLPQYSRPNDPLNFTHRLWSNRRLFACYWGKLTTDPWVIRTVSDGYKIEGAYASSIRAGQQKVNSTFLTQKFLRCMIIVRYVSALTILYSLCRLFCD